VASDAGAVTERGISCLIFQGVLAENDHAKMTAPQMSKAIPTTGKSPQLKMVATIGEGQPAAILRYWATDAGESAGEWRSGGSRTSSAVVPLVIVLFCEWAVTGSNRRPPACKAGALPAELTARSPTECRRSRGRNAHAGAIGCGEPHIIRTTARVPGPQISATDPRTCATRPRAPQPGGPRPKAK
jgi:hypothetical protein